MKDMRISEIFYSVQGEGVLCGVPSVFVRTSGCNLRCRWCDTPYASWSPEGREWSVDEVFEEVQSFGMARHVVLTGGEPMLAAGLAELSRRLHGAGYHITIETAGTVSPGEVVYDLASLSPKLSGSVPPSDAFGVGWVEKHEKLRLQPAVLREWIGGGDYQLKFVVGSRAELDEVGRLVSALGLAVPHHKVLLMPEGVESGSLLEKGRLVAEWCKEAGYRYCDRLHVHLYGHTRGT